MYEPFDVKEHLQQEYWESMGGEGPYPEGQEIPKAAGESVSSSPPIGYTAALETQVGGNHYPKGGIQPVEFIEANNIPFLEGCVIKRMVRHSKKNGVEDLNKAIHEIQLIKELRYGC